MVFEFRGSGVLGLGLGFWFRDSGLGLGGSRLGVEVKCLELSGAVVGCSGFKRGEMRGVWQST